MEQLVSMANITKTFGDVVANDKVNLTVNSGEIVALLGENGAGKSTLMNMLSGFYTPDSGKISICGEEVNIKNPKTAIKLGVGMIYQHLQLVDNLTALENIMLGMDLGIFANRKKMYKDIKEKADEYGLEVNLNEKIYNMSIGEKQTVEILKVIYHGAKILIMDEPTAVLTPLETKRLFKIMRNLVESGKGIIIITHKMNEVMEISDKVTVMRGGKYIDTLKTSETNAKTLTNLMVGEKVSLSIERPIVERGEKILRVKNLCAKNADNVDVLNDISFDIYEGEVLGIAGVSGSGQKELCEALSGLYPIDSGRIIYEGEDIKNLSPKEIIKKGISVSFVPEDRLGMGLVASMDMVDNFMLKDYMNQKSIFLDRTDLIKKCEEKVEDLQIKTPSIHTPVKTLSGGNIQKVLIGREIDTHPHILITAYVVRGLDVNSAHLIYDLINEQKKKGIGILFIGEDLDVILQFCDRIIVMCDGEITGEMTNDEASKEEIGRMMAGR